MKKNYQAFKMMFAGIIACISLSILLTGCNKEDDAINNTDDIDNPTENATVFAMEIDCRGHSNNKCISIYFTTTDTLVIPEVEVNSEIMDVYFNEPTCGWIEIAYADTVNYKITANGNTTSGSISIPNRIDNVTCNGVTSMNGEISTIDFANTFNITWQPLECDYQSMSYDDGDQNCILGSNTSSYSITSDDIVQFVNTLYFTMSIHNGDRVNNESLPGVTGDYGKGFVYSKSDSEFAFNLNPEKSGNTLIKSKPTHEERLKEFVRNFNEVCRK